MTTLLTHTEKLTRSRRLALLWTMPLSAAMCISAYWGTANFSFRFPWERELWLVFACLFAGLFAYTLHNNKHDKLMSWLGLGSMVALMMSRIILFFTGPALDDPNLSIFIGIFSYIPLLYIFSFLLLPSRAAFLTSIGIWIAFAAVTTFFTLPELMSNRQGATHLVTLMLFGQPFVIVLVAALPKYEQALKQTEVQLEKQSRQAVTDSLTSLLNRRGYDDALHKAWRKAIKSGRFCTLMMIDIDHFKSYNDCLGHPAGDACLKTVASSLAKVARKNHFVAARYGGEEFALLGLVDSKEQAELISHQIVRAVWKKAITHPDSDKGGPYVTVSVGYASMHAKGHDPRELSHNADAALYKAKSEGRNRAKRFELVA